MVDFIHTLTIERPFGVDTGDPGIDVDDWGQPVRVYDETFAEIRGLIQPKTAREMDLVSQAGTEVADHTIYMLRRDITTSDRILDTTPGGTGARYEVLGIRDHNYGSLAHMAVDARRVSSPTLQEGS